MTTREPEWTEQDQAELLALGVYRAGLCPLHGGPLADCTSHEDDGPQFVAKKIRCRATDALIAEQDTVRNPRPGALLWRTEKR